jgi:hypothetical protein
MFVNWHENVETLRMGGAEAKVCLTVEWDQIVET